MFKHPGRSIVIHFRANISGANVVPTGNESPDNKYNVCCLSFVDL